LRSKIQGYMAGLNLLGTPQYFILGWSQYADVPLSFFILATIALLCLEEKFAGGKGMPMMAGIMCSLAAWTKNEGILFFLLIVILFVVTSLTGTANSSVKRFLWFAAGTAPVIAVLVLFKFSVAPANDLISAQSSGTTLEKLMDIRRHLLIIQHLPGILTKTIPLSFLLLPYAFFIHIDRNIRGKAVIAKMLLVLSIMVVGYYFAYLI
jgi:4-amino-4-deoxy-L-arabinose transferase-like glycosyltransferase